MRKRDDMDAFGYLRDAMLNPQSAPVPAMPPLIPESARLSFRKLWRGVWEAISGRTNRTAAQYRSAPLQLLSLRPKKNVSPITPRGETRRKAE